MKIGLERWEILWKQMSGNPDRWIPAFIPCIKLCSFNIEKLYIQVILIIITILFENVRFWIFKWLI